MSAIDDASCSPPTEHLGAFRRGRERAKLVGAAMLAVASVAWVCQVQWKSRGESSASTVIPSSGAGIPAESAPSSEPVEPEIAELVVSVPGSCQAQAERLRGYGLAAPRNIRPRRSKRCAVKSS